MYLTQLVHKANKIMQLVSSRIQYTFSERKNIFIIHSLSYFGSKEAQRIMSCASEHCNWKCNNHSTSPCVRRHSRMLYGPDKAEGCIKLEIFIMPTDRVYNHTHSYSNVHSLIHSSNHSSIPNDPFPFIFCIYLLYERYFMLPQGSIKFSAEAD